MGIKLTFSTKMHLIKNTYYIEHIEYALQNQSNTHNIHMTRTAFCDRYITFVCCLRCCLVLNRINWRMNRKRNVTQFHIKLRTFTFMSLLYFCHFILFIFRQSFPYKFINSQHFVKQLEIEASFSLIEVIFYNFQEAILFAIL